MSGCRFLETKFLRKLICNSLVYFINKCKHLKIPDSKWKNMKTCAIVSCGNHSNHKLFKKDCSCDLTPYI